MDIRLALNLKRLRRTRGFSQEELAHRAKIDRTYISALERSVYAAGIDVVDRLARVLGVEAADLLIRPTGDHSERKKARTPTSSSTRQSFSLCTDRVAYRCEEPARVYRASSDGSQLSLAVLARTRPEQRIALAAFFVEQVCIDRCVERGIVELQ
jgi:transcriptional regulator with XRE-family HTH domain